MKVVIELSLKHHETLLKYAGAPTFALLTNGVKIPRPNDGAEPQVVVLCDEEQADFVLKAAIRFCQEAVPEIEMAIRVARFIKP